MSQLYIPLRIVLNHDYHLYHIEHLSGGHWREVPNSAAFTRWGAYYQRWCVRRRIGRGDLNRQTVIS